MDEKLEVQGRAKGGVARAANLSAQRRKDIAVNAAKARWEEGPSLPRAAFGSPESPLRIGDLEIPCYVLEDGTRVLSGRGMASALALGQGHGSFRRDFFRQSTLKPFVSDTLAMTLESPIRFIRPGRGGKLATGYEATILADICDAFLEARKAGALKNARLLLMAEQCEMLTRAFAKVGIIALVDEATGYQEVRDRQALQKILDKYIGKELAKWVKTFPQEFYEQIFRLKGWNFDHGSTRRPPLMAKITADLVYSRLGPGILDELRRQSPKDEKGHRKGRLFQWLTTDVGHPALKGHLSGLTYLAKAHEDGDYDGYHQTVDRVTPAFGKSMLLPFPPDPKAADDDPLPSQQSRTADLE